VSSTFFQVNTTEPLDTAPSTDPPNVVEDSKTHAFFTSWDEGRILGTPDTTTSNTSLYVTAFETTKLKTKNESNKDNDLTNDTSENDIYLESLHFPAHMLEDCPTMQTCFMYTCAPTLNAQRWRPYLAHRPIEVIQKTLKQRTQMAKLSSSIPMRRHVRSLLPFLSRKQIDETVATDTFFTNVRDVSGATCAQVFYGITSHFINVYALKTEADGPQAFEDFDRTEGLPNTIRSDNSKMQR
jgi:hypothetical protein